MFRSLADWWYRKPKQGLTAADSDSQPANVKSAPLDAFKKELDAKREKIKHLMATWEEYKTEVMGKEANLALHEHETQCALEKHDAVRSIFSAFAETVKAYFQSASANLQAQLNKEVGTEGHIKKLEAHINDLCVQVNDPSKSDDERRDLVIHLCNASIVMLTELDHLTNGFADEIWLCLKVEEREEEAAKLALNGVLIIVSGFIGMSFPLIDFDCRNLYKDLLNKAIAGQELGYELAETEVEGTLAEAGNVVIKDYVEKLRGSGGIFPRPLVDEKEKAVVATEQLRLV